MALQKFEKIHQLALKRKGGEKGLKQWLPKKGSKKKLLALGDDRYLAEMTRCIFQAGFVYRVINAKWDGFEEVFFGFDPNKLALLSPDHLERIGQDTRIVRNMQKILSVPKNTFMVSEIKREHGSVGKFIADWPEEDLIGLLAYFKKHGNRLGGMTGQRFLRNVGKDCFVLTADVIACLQNAGVDIKSNPTSQREMKLIQETFNKWHKESGLPYAHISRICACSIGENYSLD